MSRAEVQAAAIDTALRGFPLRDAAPAGSTTLLALLLAVVAPLVALRFRILVAFGVRRARRSSRSWSPRSSRSTTARSSPSSRRWPARSSGLLGTLLRRRTRTRVRRRSTACSTASRRRRGNQRTRRLRALLLLVAPRSASSSVDARGRRGQAAAQPRLRDGRHALQRPRSEAAAEGRRDRRASTTRRSTPIREPTYPLGRDSYARKVIRNLTKAGAKVIAIDVQFTEESREPEGRPRAGRGRRTTRRNGDPLHDRDRRRAARRQLFAFGKGLALQRAASRRSRSCVKDADGRVRRMMLRQAGAVELPDGRGRGEGGPPRSRRPTGRDGVDRLRGPDRARSRTISFVDVERNQFDPADVRGKVVVIGATATSLQDQHNTSTTRNFLMPGPEIQANSIATALDGLPAARGAVVGQRAADRRRRRGRAARRRCGSACGPRCSIGVAGGRRVFLVGAQVAFQHADAIVTVIYPFVGGRRRRSSRPRRSTA